MYKYKIKTRQQLSWEEEWSAKNGNDLLLSLWSSWLLFIQSKSSICQYQTQFSYLAVDCTLISIKTCISWPVTQSQGINVTRNYFLYISFIGEDISDLQESWPILLQVAGLQARDHDDQHWPRKSENENPHTLIQRSMRE